LLLRCAIAYVEQEPADPRAELFRQVRLAIAGAVLFNESIAAKVGMSSSEMQSIHLLQLHGPLTPGRLAELTDLSTGTITGVLDRLERLGLIARERHPDDRRKVVVTLEQEKLDATLTPYYVGMGEALAAAITACTEEEVATVLRFFRRLNDERP
jgi:DNA-binding MarR family transcriptional regulator